MDEFDTLEPEVPSQTEAVTEPNTEFLMPPAFADSTEPVEPVVTAEPAEVAPDGPSTGRQIFNAVKEVFETIVPAVVIALLINLFLAQATRVYGQSMEPNLHTDQRLVVEKISYNFHAPRRDDIVVLKVRKDSEELLIKRVIGLPGDTIQVTNGVVYINGEPFEEPYLASPTRGDYGPIEVPPLHVFVMGDNRNASNDSRSFGPIPLDNIIGRAWLSYWPLEQIGMVE
jgi:signal peptidase I